MLKYISCLTALCFVFLAVEAWSQTSQGGITGVVKDGSGAVISKAALVIRNDSTQTVVRSSTSNQGDYSIPGLDSGSYTISVSKKGFETQQVTGVIVETARVTTVNVTLPLGNVDVVVRISAADQLLSPDSATLSSTIDGKFAGDIPLPERSALELALLVPGAQGDPEYNGGVQSENPGVFTQPNTPGASISLSGGRPGSTAQLVDGLDVTLTAYPRAGITFSPQTISGITVQQNGLQAEYGRTAGGIINQSTAAGGSRYHGFFEWRHMDPFLQAWTYGSTTPPDAHQNLFSAIVSGPAPIPWIEHGGKTFFLASVEPLRASNLETIRSRLITPAEAAGQMHNSLDLLNQTILASSGYAAAVAAPRTGCSGGAACNLPGGNAYPGTYYDYKLNPQGFPYGVATKPYTPIPNDDVSAQLANNPLAQAFFAMVPTTATRYARYIHPDASYDSDANNGIGARGVVNSDNRYNIRVDQIFNDYNHAFVRYTRVPVNGVRFNYFGPDDPLDSTPTDKYNSQNWAVNYVHEFHGAETNVARASYIRTNRFRGPVPASLTKDFGASLGLLPAVNGVGFPTITFTPNTGVPSLGSFGAGGSITDGGLALDSSLSYGDDFSLVKGDHSIQIGGEFRFLDLDRKDVSYLTGGQYNFPGTFTGGGTAGGSSLSSFILGLINTYTTGAPQEYYYRSKYFAAYVQDNWRIRPNLTLNLGLRYNLETPRTEKNYLQGTFLPNIGGAVAVGAAEVPATGGFAFSGTYGLPNSMWPTFYKGFEPRIGIAYLPKPFMTVRASYTLVHPPLTGLGNAITPNLAPATQSVGPTNGGVMNSTPGDTLWTLDTITNPVAPIALASTQTRAGGPLYTYSATAYLPVVNQSNAVPYTQLWSFSMQFALGSSTLIETTYAGQHATHLFTLPVSTNVPSFATSVADASSGANYTSTLKVNQYGISVTGLQNQNPYQQFAKNPMNTAYDRLGNSIYHAFYATIRQRAKGGVTLFGSFAWSKSIDNASSGSLSTVATDIWGIINPQLPYNYSTERSLSTYDTPVKVSLAYNWILPFGTQPDGSAGRFQTGNRILNFLIGGYTTSGILTAQSGYPWWIELGNCGWFASTLPGSYNGSGGCTLEGEELRPNIVPGVPLIQKNWKKDPFGTLPGDSYINPAAFAIPGSPGNPQLGDAPRTLGGARNPRTIYYDASIRKTFGIVGQRLHVTLFMDAINAANHTNFFPSTAATTRGPFGAITTSGTYTTSAAFGKFSQSANIPGREIALGIIVRF